MPQVLWSPRDSAHTELHRFMRFVNLKRNIGLLSYNDLYHFSISVDSFWSDLFEFLQFIYEGEPRYVLAGGLKLSELSMYPPPKFFPEVNLNYAENCLEGFPEEAIAVICAREAATNIERYNFRDLKSRVHLLSYSMRAAGVRKGDCVAGILSNSIHAVTIVLATASLGAVCSMTATDMGLSGILDRLEQSRPKVIFFDNGSYYNAKYRDLLVNAEAVLQSIKNDSLTALVIVPHITHMSTELPGSPSKSFSLHRFHETFSSRSTRLVYTRLAFTGMRNVP